MKNFFYGCLVWLLIGPGIGFSQQTTQKYSFFEPGTKSAKQDYSSDVEDGVLLEFSADMAKAFSREAPQAFEMDLAIDNNGEKFTLKLEKANILAEGFVVVSSKNPDKALDIDLGLHYRGVVEGETNSLVAISVHDDYVCGLVRTSRGNYNLGKLENSQKGHIVYLDRLLKHPFSFECGTEEEGHIQIREVPRNNGGSRNAGDCIRIYVEVDDHIVTNAGSVAAAGQFATDLFNQTFTLFADEQINMMISKMKVWDTPDPYIGPLARTYLSEFQANINPTDGIEGDLGHLLVITGGGGAAVVDGLCKNNIDSRLGISNVENSEVVDVPTYSWNVNVLAHELGHQLGSRHTHACAWNGNNSVIDDCGNVWLVTNMIDDDMDGVTDEPTEAEGFSCWDPTNPVLPANEGTILSYCHLDDDIGVNLVFHSQVSDRMRDRVDNAVCLHSDCGDCELALDCSNVPSDVVQCLEDVPNSNKNLIIVESACAWPISTSNSSNNNDVIVTETGTATPGDPLVRTYTVTDPLGNEATCVQYFIGTGSSVAVTSAWPTQCVLSDFTINGNYSICDGLSITSLELEFWQSGIASGVSVTPTLDPSTNTWIFSSSVFAMEQAGLPIGNWYDIYPFLTLSNGDVILGDELEFGFNNDIRFAGQSDPQVILNEEEDDLTTSQLTFCAGDPIYYHGTDPLSGNHFVSITRRLSGTDNPYTNYYKFGGPSGSGWVGESLDGYTADLQSYFVPNNNYTPPECLVAGYDYKLQIASSNNPECITWSPIYIEFKIVDCCAPDWELVDVPECVVDDEVSTLTVILDGPIDPADIGYIYSSNNDYTVIDREIIDHQNTLELTIYFVSNHCTCEGNSFIFDIDLSCNSTVWIMTDHIPCCDTDCEFLEIVDWSADEECIVINGNPGHEFCIEVSSDIPILNVIPGSNSATCQVELIDLEITEPGMDGMYSICGYMAFTDPECVGFAIVTLVLETENGCCTIQQGFSFPDGCELEEPCFGGDPEIQIIYSGYMNVSLNLPLGETVLVTDHITGSIQVAQVETILCGPFGITQGGVIIGGTDCNGIEISSPLSLNCNKVEGETPYLPYHFEIAWGNCTWILIGNYCDELIAVQTSQEGETGRRSEDASINVDTPSGQMLIFPNPLTETDVLNFDVSNLNQNIQNIQISDLQGRPIESFIPESNEQIFSHRLAKPLPPGVYFIMVKLQDGSINGTKLISVK